MREHLYTSLALQEIEVDDHRCSCGAESLVYLMGVGSKCGPCAVALQPELRPQMIDVGDAKWWNRSG